MCEFCPVDGRPCSVCGYHSDADEEAAHDLHGMIDAAAARVADLTLELQAATEHLARLRKLDGRRPGDGSDQPALFDAARQPAMF